MKKFLISLMMICLNVCSILGQEFMKVSGEKVLTEDNRRCYQIRKGYSRKDKTPWEPFCGEFKNFYYESGYEYTMHVEKYDASLDTIKVIKTIGRDNSDAYRRRQEMLQKAKESQNKK